MMLFVSHRLSVSFSADLVPYMLHADTSRRIKLLGISSSSGSVVAVMAAMVILALDRLLPEHYRGLKLTELYSFYTLSKNTKNLLV